MPNNDEVIVKKYIPVKKIFETIITGLLLAALGWAWALESRLARLEEQQNVVQRVENLENLLQPVLIEYRMRERLRELGINIDYPLSSKEAEEESPEHIIDNINTWGVGSESESIMKETQGFTPLDKKSEEKPDMDSIRESVLYSVKEDMNMYRDIK